MADEGWDLIGADQQVRTIRYLPHALVTTATVMVIPTLAVYAAERVGGWSFSFPVACSMAFALSVLLGVIGTMAWTRWGGAADVVFADLMLWGWIARLRAERRLGWARNLGLDERALDAADIDPPHQLQILKKLAADLETRDPYTHQHTRRVTRYAHAIAKTMKLPADQVHRIRAAAAVHDVGKLGIPADVLHKPGKLTDEEFGLIKQHAALGADLVDKTGNPELTALVRSHHERIDGRGYPDGLAGDAIPLGARVIAVADTFDAVTSTRAYRHAAAHKAALDVIRNVSGTQLDPECVKAFLRWYSGRRARSVGSAVFSNLRQAPNWVALWIRKGTVSAVGRSVATIAVATAVGTASIVAPGAETRDAPRHASAAEARGFTYGASTQPSTEQGASDEGSSESIGDGTRDDESLGSESDTAPDQPAGDGASNTNDGGSNPSEGSNPSGGGTSPSDGGSEPGDQSGDPTSPAEPGSEPPSEPAPSGQEPVGGKQPLPSAPTPPSDGGGTGDPPASEPESPSEGPSCTIDVLGIEICL